MAAKADVSFGGYLRAGLGEAPDHKGRACYALGGTGLKYRLGNECDVYGEFLLAHRGTVDGMQVRESLMLSDYVPDTGKGAGLQVAQLWIEARGWRVAPEATLWVGKERGRRGDVHLVDAFFVEMAGIGAGIRRIAIGPGQAGIAAYTNETGPSVRRLNLEYEDVPLTGGGLGESSAPSEEGFGTLSLYATLIKSHQSGAALTALHRLQMPTFGLTHRLWIQVAEGSAGLNVNAGDLDRPLHRRDWRIASSPSWQSGPWGGEAMVMLARETSGDHEQRSWSAGARVAYAIKPFLKLQAEAGATRTRKDGGAMAALHKLTLAPTLALSPDYWSRPELRFYVTRAWWNQQALLNAAFNTHLDSTGVGTTWGVHFETWF